MPHGLDGSASEIDDSVTAADADFGDIEMFDSNLASQPPMSSQANNPVSSGGHAPVAVMSEDTVASQPSKQSRRDKKEKRKKERKEKEEKEEKKEKKGKKEKKKSSSQIESSQPLAEDDGSRKQKKSKRKSTAEADVGDGEPAVMENGTQAGEVVPAAGAVTDDGDDAVTHLKKKRKLSDSAASQEERKRRRPRQEDDDGFLRKENEEGKDKAMDEDGRVDESDVQLSPTVAHLGRRSQAEARSRENSAPLAAADGMDVDRSEAPAAADVEVETLAREAWKQHRSSQGRAKRPSREAQEAQEATASSASRTRSARRKAKPTYFDQAPVDEPEANRAALAALPSPAAATPKRRQRTKAASKKASKAASKDQAPAGERRGMTQGESRRGDYVQGRFTDEELARIGRAVEAFRTDSGLTREQVNEMIQAPGGTTAGDAHAQLWVRIFAECPDRHRQKVINICRKKFHNFVARGTWTAEQDGELGELIGVHGPRWSKIAGIINRHPEDLRDRYRNYLVCGAHQRKDAWDEDEEARLTQFIIEAMEIIDELREAGTNEQLRDRSYEELIDWQNISERMGRSRSRLQCITKWKSMNIRTNGKDKLVSAEPDAQISFRLEKARRQLSAMPDEERFRLVLAIQASAVGSDGKIPWPRLVDKPFRNKWHRTTQVLLWRRLKRTVPGWERQATRDTALHLVEQYKQTGELPVVDGAGCDDGEEMALVKSVPSGTTAGRRSRKQGAARSGEFVEGSDVDDGPAHDDDGEAGEDTEGMQIDPALTPSLPKATEQSGAEKAAPRRRGKKAAANGPREPAEEGELPGPLPVPREEDGPEADEAARAAKRTPRKARSTAAKGHGDTPSGVAYSDSVMDDMEDLPARVAA
ncbi:hypothetical protein RJ55_01952 [Drechmeria coniospora]|nr:hypothetical protein RJ55_01952 [Drechmeria coniospora]